MAAKRPKSSHQAPHQTGGQDDDDPGTEAHDHAAGEHDENQGPESELIGAVLGEEGGVRVEVTLDTGIG